MKEKEIEKQYNEGLKIFIEDAIASENLTGCQYNTCCNNDAFQTIVKKNKQLEDKLNKIRQLCKEKPLIYEGGNRETSCYLGNLTETEKRCYELALEEVEEIIGGNDSK